MKLRKLQLKDASLMLEWMHNKEIVRCMRGNFVQKTIEDCKDFIEESWDDRENLHLAIVDDQDTYMGTVSLKYITEDSAEFAIIVRKYAMGKGFSKFAMLEIMRIGLKDWGLNQIYWCVAPENKRAIRFYEKNGYQKISPNELVIKGYSKEQISSYCWYREDRKTVKEKIFRNGI